MIRGYVRDLKTGEEIYLSDPSSLGSEVRRRLEKELRKSGATSGSDSQQASGQDR